MSDFINSVKSILYDRAVSPLFGTFAIAWCLCNYKFLLVLISELPVSGKIIYIEYELYPNFWAIIPLIIVPAIATVLAIYVYPKLAEPVFRHVSQKKAALRKIKQDSDESILDEAMLKLQRAYSEQRINAKREIGFRDEDIELHKKLVDQLTEENVGLKNMLAEKNNAAEVGVAADDIAVGGATNNDENLSPDDSADRMRSASSSRILSPTQTELLQAITLSDVVSIDRLSKEKTPSQRVRLTYDLNALEKHGFITKVTLRKSDGDRIPGYRISPDGTVYVVENDLV